MTTITNNTANRLKEQFNLASTETREAEADLAKAKQDGASSTVISQLEEKVELAKGNLEDVTSLSARADSTTDEVLNDRLDGIETKNQTLDNIEDYEPSKLLDMTPAERLQFQRTDPKGFREELSKVSSTEKQEIYMGIQNEVQSENRFWSMMTNLQQASHDTQKAILSNFRV